MRGLFAYLRTHFDFSKEVFQTLVEERQIFNVLIGRKEGRAVIDEDSTKMRSLFCEFLFLTNPTSMDVTSLRQPDINGIFNFLKSYEM